MADRIDCKQTDNNENLLLQDTLTQLHVVTEQLDTHVEWTDENRPIVICPKGVEINKRVFKDYVHNNIEKGKTHMESVHAALCGQASVLDELWLLKLIDGEYPLTETLLPESELEQLFTRIRSENDDIMDALRTAAYAYLLIDCSDWFFEKDPFENYVTSSWIDNRSVFENGFRDFINGILAGRIRNQVLNAVKYNRSLSMTDKRVVQWMLLHFSPSAPDFS